MIALPPPAVVQEAPSADDLVIVGRRLRTIRFRYAVRGGRLKSCDVRKTSGDAITDAVVCETVGQCVDERQLRHAEMVACLGARKPMMTAAIAERKKTRHAQD